MAERQKYDAFISYRHAEKDMFVAETLHKALEEFKLPKVLKKKGVVTSKSKITRIFRDRDELPLASNLSDQINMALEDSEFLIVICSPRLKESLWCKREIQQFKKLHGQEHILAVLIEGEPDNSFPEEILFREEEATLPDGRKELVTVAVEPLAADVRGASNKEIKKKIKEEVVRLAAPIFNVNYDDLKQRHHERMLHRVFAISGLVSAVFLSFAVISSSLAWKISNQRNEIAKQNDEISKQNTEIIAQNQQIEEQSAQITEQYKQILVSLAENYALESDNAYKNNDRHLSLEKAIAAVSTDDKGNTLPFTEAGQSAIINATNAYGIGLRYIPAGRVYTKNNVVKMDSDSTFTKIYVEDYAGETYVYDTVTREQLAFFDACPSASGTVYSKDDFIQFVDTDSIAYASNKDLHILNYETGEDRVLFSAASNITGVIYNEVSKTFYVSCVSKYYLFNYEDNLFVSDPEAPRLASGHYNDYAAFSSDGSLVAFTTEQSTPYNLAEGVSVKICSTTDGHLLSDIPISDMTSAGFLRFVDDVLIVETSESYSVSKSYNSHYEIVALDYKEGTELWRKTIYENVSAFRHLVDSDTYYLGIYSGHSLLSVDAKTGEVGFSWDFDADTMKAYVMTSNYFVAITANGSYYVASPINGICSLMYDELGKNIVAVCQTDGGIYLAESKKDYAYILSRETGDRIEVLVDESTYSYMISDDAKTYYRKNDDNTLQAIDIATGEILWTTECSSLYTNMLANGNILLFDNHDYSIIDAKNGEIIYSFTSDLSLSRQQVLGNTLIYSIRYDYYRLDAENPDPELIFTNTRSNNISRIAFSTTGDYIAYVDYENENVNIEKDEQVLFSCDEIISDVSNILFTPDDKYVMIQHTSGAYRIYDMATGNLVSTNLENPTRFSEIILGTSDYPYIFQSGFDGIWLNQNFEQALSSTALVYTPSNGKLVMKYNRVSYTVPLYTIEMALEDAKNQLERYR